MERYEYFIKRLLLVIPTFIGITFVCFLICQFVPGGPMEQYMLSMRAIGGGGEAIAQNDGSSGSLSERQMEEIREAFGFNEPFVTRYMNWLIRDRMGMQMESYAYKGQTAWEVIAKRFPVSLIFGITGFVLTYLICIPLGIAKAIRNGSRFDVISSVVVFIGYAIPAYALGMVLRMLFCGTVEGLWDIFPAFGFTSDEFDSLTFGQKAQDIFMHMFLPVTCYVIGNFAVLTLLMKNSLLDQIGADYVRTVIAKGATARYAIWKHALRNSLIPLATGIGGILTIMFAGSVLIEKIFEIDGMGLLSLNAIVGRDYAVFMGTLALTSILGLIGNIIQDFCYILLDPRINFDR